MAYQRRKSDIKPFRRLLLRAQTMALRWERRQDISKRRWIWKDGLGEGRVTNIYIYFKWNEIWMGQVLGQRVCNCQTCYPNQHGWVWLGQVWLDPINKKSKAIKSGWVGSSSWPEWLNHKHQHNRLLTSIPSLSFLFFILGKNLHPFF